MKPGLRKPGSMAVLALILALPLTGCAAQNELERKVAYLDRQDGRTMRLDSDQNQRLSQLENNIRLLDKESAQLKSRALADEQMIMTIYDTVERVRKELKMAPFQSERLRDLDERLKRLEASVEVMWPKVIKRK
ncbi:MAG: hypothetical protein PHC70_00560 [Patescibacteria group bacterium]|nr:hypothetical protein [Patescibacteria group bacterium]